MTETPRRPNIVLMIVCGLLTTMVVIAFARLAYGVILPQMRSDLGMSYQQAGLLGTVTAMGYLGFVLIGGITAARWGARVTVMFGLVSVSIGFAGLSLASSYSLMMLLMALLGFGTAFCFAPMVALLATWYPERRGLVIGCMTSGVGLGTLVVGIMVPLFYQWFGDSGWRYSWGMFAVTAVTVAVLVIVFVRDPPRTVLGEGEKPPSADKLKIYHHPRVLMVAVVYGIIGLTYIIQTVFMVSFMVESGFPESTAGKFVAMMGLLSLAAGPLWGWLSDHWGRGNALSASMGLVTLSMALPLISQTQGMFFLHFLIIGLSVNGMFALIQASATDQVASRYIPIAFSFVTVFFATGQLIGPAMAGWIIDVTSDFRIAFGFTFAMLVLGTYLAMKIRGFPRTVAVGDD